MLLRSVFAVVFNLIFYGVLLFAPAGTLDWPRAWFFLAVLFVAILVTVAILFPGHQALMRERMKPPVQKGQPLADKVLILLFLVGYVASVLFVPIDRFRLRLTEPPGAIVSSLGLVLFLAGWTILVLAMRENRFAAPVVKHQKERGQHVIDSGVYAIVRHPMYAGGALLMIGLPLFLESYAAALVACVPAALVVARIFVEEPFLKRELAGYESYTDRVRYRLVPYLW